MNRAIRIIISIISAWILMGLTSVHCSTLFNKGKSKYVIVLCQNPSQSEQTSAHELQDYLKQIGGVTIPVIEYDQLRDGQKHIFVGFNEKYAASCGVERPQEKDESYAYRTIGDNIWIYGGSERGTMYGVYSFLENELGVRWYTKDYTRIIPHNKWSFKELNHSETPHIGLRFVQYCNVEPHKEWLAHNKCNSVWTAQENEYGGLTAYWNAHTFEQFIPSNVYFKEHPEYFSLRDGERKPYTQLCLSNPDVLKICIEKMKGAIAANPLYWVYSMSQSDNQLPCQCEKCRAIEEQYGGHSGLMVWFVNQVADAIKPIYPDKYIGTFAYQYTRKAPKGITPRENVVIRLCSIECCFAHPLEECEHNKPFISDIKEWSKIAPHLFIWDYVVNYHQYLAPFPNFGVLAENIKTFKKYNAIGIQEEAQYESIGGEFSDMKSWVLAKLLWNPDLDTFALVREFISNYYGAAAPYIQQYFDLCHSLIKDDTVMGIYINQHNPLYTDEFVDEAQAILAKAKEAVADDNEQMQLRVDKVVLQIKYLYMMRKPQQAIADGTRDWVFDFIRKHGILVNEPLSIEEAIKRYNNQYDTK